MAVKVWHPLRFRYCQHVDEEVALQAEVVYPAEWLPEGPPRVLAHRCSRGIDCNLESRPSCVWAGTNPIYDPFSGG